MSIKESISLAEADNIINYVDKIIIDAHQQSVSDIHFEPMLHYYRIRYRQHGQLYNIVNLSANLAIRCITRLKVMSQLDISEKRLPQDGRLQVQLPDKSLLDIRLSVCPMLWGEKIVLRLLYANTLPKKIDNLGLTCDQHQILLNAINKPQGLIIITGPTGSGKTTTLYAILQQLNTPTVNITTIEDPIEIHIDGINQVQLQEKIGLNFATALRAMLRQDPDVIMIGEIRDQLTAEIALQAAQTGHLVLATLHTNNCIASLARLQYLGCSGYQIANSLSLVISQRLVKTICSTCNNQPVSRIAIFECLSISTGLKEHIIRQSPPATILASAVTENFITLEQAGFLAVQAGKTSLDELYRVL